MPFFVFDTGWELYGAVDREHSPSTGSKYSLELTRSTPFFDWAAQWDVDEGRNTSCADAGHIRETHDALMQRVDWEISYPPS